MIEYLFFFHMVHGSLILGQGWLLSNNFCTACQTCLHPSFVIVHKAVRMHQLLLCCESSRKCHHAAQTTPTWTKPIFTHTKGSPTLSYMFWLHFLGSSSSFVSIISEFSHMFGQALAQWRAFSLAVARSSRLHSFSRSGHLSRCCMVCSEVPHSQAVSAVSA